MTDLLKSLDLLSTGARPSQLVTSLQAARALPTMRTTSCEVQCARSEFAHVSLSPSLFVLRLLSSCPRSGQGDNREL